MMMMDSLESAIAMDDEDGNMQTHCTQSGHILANPIVCMSVRCRMSISSPVGTPVGSAELHARTSVDSDCSRPKERRHSSHALLSRKHSIPCSSH